MAANLRQYLSDKTLTDAAQITARDRIVSALDNFLSQRQTHGGIPNSDLVSTLRVEGEFTSAILGPVLDPIGAPATLLQHGPTDISPFTELHAQSCSLPSCKASRAQRRGNR